MNFKEKFLDGFFSGLGLGGAIVLIMIFVLIIMAIFGYPEAHAQESTANYTTIKTEVSQDWIDGLEGNTISLASLALLLVMSAAFTLAFLISHHPTMMFFSIASIMVSLLLALMFLSPQPIAYESLTNPVHDAYLWVGTDQYPNNGQTGLRIDYYGNTETLQSEIQIQPDSEGLRSHPLQFEQTIIVDRDDFWRMPLALIFFGKKHF